MQFDSYVKKIKKNFDFKAYYIDTQYHAIAGATSKREEQYHVFKFNGKGFCYKLKLKKTNSSMMTVSLSAKMKSNIVIETLVNQICKDKNLTLNHLLKEDIIRIFSKVSLINCDTTEDIAQVMSKVIELVKNFEETMKIHVFHQNEVNIYHDMSRVLTNMTPSMKYFDKSSFMNFSNNVIFQSMYSRRISHKQIIDTDYKTWFVNQMNSSGYRYRYRWTDGTIPSETVNLTKIREKAKRCGKTYIRNTDYHTRWLLRKGNKLYHEFQAIQPSDHSTVAKKVAQRQHHKEIRGSFKKQIHQFMKGNIEDEILISDTPNKWWD